MINAFTPKYYISKIFSKNLMVKIYYQHKYYTSKLYMSSGFVIKTILYSFKDHFTSSTIQFPSISLSILRFIICFIINVP